MAVLMVQVGARPQAPTPDDEHIERAGQITIIEWYHAAIMAVTSGGVISSCNSAGAELYGCNPREIIGKAADILIPPERRPVEAAFLQRVLDGDVVQDYLTDRLRRDGTTVAVSVAISRLVDSAGAVQGTVTVARPVHLKTARPKVVPPSGLPERFGAPFATGAGSAQIRFHRPA